MAESLDYDNGCSSETWVYNTDVGWCGYYTDGPFTNEGLLYQWSAAMNDSIVDGAQGICPADWHIPTDDEWYNLEKPSKVQLENFLSHAAKVVSNLNLYLVQELFEALGNETSDQNKLLMAIAFFRIPENKDFIKNLFHYLGGNNFNINITKLQHQQGLIQYSTAQKRYYLNDILKDFYYEIIEDKKGIDSLIVKFKKAFLFHQFQCSDH